MKLRQLIASQRLPAAVLVAVAALSLGDASAPAPTAAALPAKCSVAFYFIDQDATTNIRSKPSGAAAVRATIDPATTVAHVVDSSNGWFRVDRVTNAENDAVLFRGDGWIHKSVLGLSVASGEHWLRSLPAVRSKRLQKLVPDGSNLAPLSCSGGWVQVRVDGQATGWIDHATICENPLTTCS